MGTGSGLARAFYRLFILYALEAGPQRPTALLGALHACEGAPPVEGGAFSRAIAQLVDGGLVVPIGAGAFELTPLGRRERDAQRIVWERLIAIVGRLIGGEVPRPEPPEDGGTLLPIARDRVSEEHAQRVVLAEIRALARRAREGGPASGVVLADIAIAHPRPATVTAMLQRALRETLGRARSTFGPDVSAHRYGASAVCLLVSTGDVDAVAELVRARVLESLGAMRATVKAFAGARYAVRIGAGRFSTAASTSGAVLRLAEAALAAAVAARAA